MKFVPDNCLVGLNDKVPGLVGSKLPINPDEIATKVKAAQLRTVYAHNIRISSMNEIEKAFLMYLKDLRS
jgi:hypothetical protein